MTPSKIQPQARTKPQPQACTKSQPQAFTEHQPQASPGIACYYSTEPADALLQRDDVLAVISQGADCVPGMDSRHYHCGLDYLHEQPLHEVWYSDGPVTTGTDGACHWSQSANALFAARWVDYSSDQSPQDAIYTAYRNLIDLLQQRGFPTIVRMWNYLPAINRGDGDNEHYRQFCLGRQRAFAESHYDCDTFPSACALGHQRQNSVIYLLATADDVIHLENPRQEAAYHYPRQYGPASPSFARASIANWKGWNQLFLSGTASIVGHESQHADDLQLQLTTTFNNIDTLLQSATEHCGGGRAPAMSMLKVYVRNPQDYPAIHERVAARFPNVPTQYLQADICRQELLVEIDGLSELTEYPGAQE